DDPLLVDLVAAAQTVSPDIASAGARIAEARSARVAARAAMLPSVDANVSATRGNAQTGVPLSTIVQNTVQTAWEIDLFGGLGARQRRRGCGPGHPAAGPVRSHREGAGGAHRAGGAGAAAAPRHALARAGPHRTAGHSFRAGHGAGAATRHLPRRARRGGG